MMSTQQHQWKSLHKASMSMTTDQGCVSKRRSRRNSCVRRRAAHQVPPPGRLNIVRLDEPNLITQVVAMDCEFVGTGPKGRVSALGRASVLNERGDVLLDVMCLPDEPVTDYRTPWSGLRPADLIRGLPFDTVQDLVRRAVRGRILVGHALHNDLGVLRLHHPEGLVRDTSVCALLKEKAGLPRQGKQPASLRNLALTLLNLRIQRREHDSVQDADASLKLYMLVAEEWEAELAVRGVPVLDSVQANGNTASSSSSSPPECSQSPASLAAAEKQKRQEARLLQLSYSNPESAAKLTSRRQLRPGFIGTWQDGEADNLLDDDKYW